MTKYDVVKANSLQGLRKRISDKIASGLTPLGYPAVVYMRNTFNKRIAIYYQSVALVQLS